VTAIASPSYQTLSSLSPSIFAKPAKPTPRVLANLLPRAKTASFPMIGKKVSNDWKILPDFSNDWKKFSLVFQ
jgi:hypothetical protein